MTNPRNDLVPTRTLRRLRGAPVAARSAAAVGLLITLPLVSACSGQSNASASSATPAAGSTGSTSQPAAPGVSGQIAAVQGTTLQVQGNNQQTAVNYSSSTSIRSARAGTVAEVTVGSCVVVRPATTTATPGAGATTPSGGTAQTLTAGTVEISAPVNGSCTGAGAFGQGGRQGQRPTGSATGGTSNGGASNGGTGGANRGGGYGRGGVTGMVASVGAGTFTVTPQARPAGGGSTGTGQATTPAAQTVTEASSTTYSVLATGAASDLSVGRCVTALGSADSTGAISATSITVRDAVNGSCMTAGAGPRSRAGASATATGS